MSAKIGHSLLLQVNQMKCRNEQLRSQLDEALDQVLHCIVVDIIVMSSLSSSSSATAAASLLLSLLCQLVCSQTQCLLYTNKKYMLVQKLLFHPILKIGCLLVNEREFEYNTHNFHQQWRFDSWGGYNTCKLKKNIIFQKTSYTA